MQGGAGETLLGQVYFEGIAWCS